MEVEQNASAVVEDLKPDIPKPVKKKSLMRSFKKGMSKRVKSMRASMENFAEAVRTSSFRSSSSMRRSAKNAVAEAEAVDGGFENETDLPPTSTNGVHERVLDDANPPPKTDAKLAEQDTLSSEAAAAEARKAIEDSVKLHIDGAAVISEGQDLGDIKQEPAGDSDALEMPTTDADTTQAEHKELPLKTRVVQADLVQDVQLLVTPREAEDGVDLVLAVRRQEKRRRASGRKVLLPGVLAGAAVAAAAVLLRAWA